MSYQDNRGCPTDLNKISFSFTFVPVPCIVVGSNLKSCIVRHHFSRSTQTHRPSSAAAYPANFEIYRLENVISSVNHSKLETDSNV